MSRRVSLPSIAPAAASAGVVDVLTGAQLLVPPVPEGPLDEAAARDLTNRIRATAREIGDRLTRLRLLVDQARDGQAWVPLGYASWTAYLADALEPMRLPRGERREVVRFLTGEGLSTRAIAPIVSADPKTVRNDRRALASAEKPRAGGESSPPAEVVTGLDGRLYPQGSSARPTLVVVPPVTDSPALPLPAPDDVDGFLGRLAALIELHGRVTTADWRSALEPGDRRAVARR
jgi:hypothetical protein